LGEGVEAAPAFVDTPAVDTPTVDAPVDVITVDEPVDEPIEEPIE
jgi:hypothetical protein